MKPGTQLISFNLQHCTSQSHVRNVNMTDNSHRYSSILCLFHRFIQLFAIRISTWNIFVLFGIIKYLKTGYPLRVGWLFKPRETHWEYWEIINVVLFIDLHFLTMLYCCKFHRNRKTTCLHNCRTFCNTSTYIPKSIDNL